MKAKRGPGEPYIIVEHEQPLLGLLVQLSHLGAVQARGLMSRVLRVDLLQKTLDKDGGPSVRGVGRNGFVQRPVSPPLLLIAHGKTTVDRRCDVLFTNQQISF